MCIRLRVVGCALCVALFLSPPGASAAEEDSGAINALPEYTVEHFGQYRLYAACKPVKLIIDHASPAALQVGLTEQTARLTAEAFLRRALIAMVPEPQPAFMRTVVFFGDSKVGTEITVHFMKMLWDALSNQSGYSSTWSHTILVPYGQNNKDQYLSALSHLLKNFIKDYTAQNAKPCL